MKKKPDIKKEQEISPAGQRTASIPSASVQPQPPAPAKRISKERLREVAVEDEKIIKVIRALLSQDENNTVH